MCDRLKHSAARVITAMIVATASCAIEAATVLSTEVVDLTKTPIQGLPRSLKVNLKDGDWTGRHALVVLVPKFGAYLSDSPYREQAEYFVKAGYVTVSRYARSALNRTVQRSTYPASASSARKNGAGEASFDRS